MDSIPKIKLTPDSSPRPRRRSSNNRRVSPDKLNNSSSAKIGELAIEGVPRRKSFRQTANISNIFKHTDILSFRMTGKSWGMGTETSERVSLRKALEKDTIRLENINDFFAEDMEYAEDWQVPLISIRKTYVVQQAMMDNARLLSLDKDLNEKTTIESKKTIKNNNHNHTHLIIKNDKRFYGLKCVIS